MGEPSDSDTIKAGGSRRRRYLGLAAAAAGLLPVRRGHRQRIDWLQRVRPHQRGNIPQRIPQRTPNTFRGGRASRRGVLQVPRRDRTGTQRLMNTDIMAIEYRQAIPQVPLTAVDSYQN